MIRRNKIREGYDLIQPTHEQKERMLESIFAAASAKTPAGKDVPMKHIKKKTVSVLIAAAVAMLLMGSAVVLMRLDDLEIGEYSYTQPAWINADGERIEETQITKNVISLQGIAGSDSQMAAQEWYEFKESYDTDRKILNASDNFQAPRVYDAYHVYSQEMMEKADEIAEKYGLKLTGRMELVQDWQKDIFFEELGIDSLFVENAQAEMGFGAGYFYECGNFKMEFDCEVTDPAFQWKHPLFVTMNYKDKEYLDTVFVHLNAGSTQQRVLTLNDGTEVLLVLVEGGQTGDSAHVFCDREDAFVSLRIDTNYFNDDGSVDVMSQEDLELAINLMDFGVKPQMPNMEEAIKKLEAADKVYQDEMEARMAEMGDPFHVASYKELSNNYENGYFCLMDLNGDGLEECLLWDEYGCIDVYTMIDGTTEPIANMAGESYLCQDNVIEFYEEVGQAYYVHDYLKMEGSQMVHVDRLVYDRANEAWSRSNDGIRAEEEITEEEADQIRTSYIRTDFEKKPISEMQ